MKGVTRYGEEVLFTRPHTTAGDALMIGSFEEFCTWVYVVVDDLWQQIAPLFRRPGPQPECSDSELLAMILIGECRGWDGETHLLS